MALPVAAERLGLGRRERQPDRAGEGTPVRQTAVILLPRGFCGILVEVAGRRRLTEMGIAETEGSITVKINRGGFPAWFMMAAMKAIGVREVRLD